MKFYYFNDSIDVNGFHEVHAEDCKYVPTPSHRTLIGYCSSCTEAISEAKSRYSGFSFDGCFWCCRECHHG
nr:MAG TPA: hypothetical protein [Caudoviricetes sp.]